MEIDKALERLKFEPSRLPDLSLATVLPRDIEGSPGLDSLDFGTLVDYISRMADR